MTKSGCTNAEGIYDNNLLLYVCLDYWVSVFSQRKIFRLGYIFKIIISSFQKSRWVLRPD